MSPVAAASIFSVWLLVVGGLAVYFEVESVYCGVRVQKLLNEEAGLLDEVRRLELQYNELVSPDLLERWLREREELATEYLEYRFPIPRKDGTSAQARGG